MHDLLRLEETADRAAALMMMISHALECAAAQSGYPHSAQAWLERAHKLAKSGEEEMRAVWQGAMKERLAFEASCPEAAEPAAELISEVDGRMIEGENWNTFTDREAA